MNNFDCILTSEQYQKLAKEYSQLFKTEPHTAFSLLCNIIKKIEVDSFKLPLALQNSIANKLLLSRKILQTLTTSKPTIDVRQLKNNPFNLIIYLSTISKHLTSHNIKSPHLTISLKANKLILDCIEEICMYFAGKYKF